MIAPRFAALGLSLSLALAGSGVPDETATRSFVLKGALVHTGTGAPIENAVIVVTGGRIAAVGRDVAIPAGLKVLDAAGKVVIPGMIDAYSRIGMSAAGEAPEPSKSSGPENRAIDDLRLDISDWPEAVRAGITTVVTGPGPEARIGGQSITLKTFGEDIGRRVLRPAGELVAGINGTNLSEFPALRAQFLKARDRLEKRESYESGGRKGPAPETDLGLEAVAGALEGKETLRVHVLWAHDILSLLELKDEFGLDLVLIDAPEAWKVAGEIARRGVSVVCMPMVLNINVPEDLLDGIASLPGSGVRIAFRSNHPASPQKWFRLNAAMAIRHGLPKDRALSAMTIDAARTARIDDRVGTIETGKDADLVVLDGPWFEPVSKIDQVFVDGVLAFDRQRDERPMAEEN